MEAVFYQIDKRHNSTKVPSSTDTGSPLEVQLKDGTDIMRPVFLISITAIPYFNMVYFSAHYYKIIDITNVRNNLFEIACELDVLATYRYNIFNTTAFVMYDTAANTEIVDHRLPIKTTKTVLTSGGAGFHTSSNPSIVVTITGVSSTASYAMSMAQAQQLLNATSLSSYFNSWIPAPTGNDFSQIAESIVYAFRQLITTGKAGDSIKNAMAIPLSLSQFTGVSETVVMGGYYTDVQALRLTSRHYAESLTITIPWQASDWRRNRPYHELYLVIPAVGVIELSPSDLIDDTTINVMLDMDVITGEAKVTVYTGSLDRQIGIYAASFGASYAIGSSNISAVQAVNSIASLGAAAVGLATGSGAAALAGNWLAASASSIAGNPTCIGTFGGAASMGADVRIWMYSIFHDTVSAPAAGIATMGTPTMAVKSLSGMLGYVETRNFSVSGTMTDPEREEINRLMDGGVYLE